MNTRKRRRLLIGSILLALLTLAIADYWLFPAFASPSGKVANLNANGLWVRYTWYFGQHSVADQAAMAKRVQQGAISDVFFHVRGIEANGKLKYRFPEKARALNADLKRLAPNVRRIAWVYVGNAHGLGHVDLSNAQVRAAMVAEAVWLVRECGFDGVQWDYEICSDGDPYLLKLLEESRAALPKAAFLGVAAPTWYPFPLSGVGWSEAYYEAVAKRCDQLAIMAYDTAAYSPRAFVWFVSEQVVRITRAAGRSGSGCRVLLGLPTYDDGTLSHNPRAENLRMSLLGVRNGLAGGADLSAWQGVALFADYTTDDREWNEYRKLWQVTPTP